MTRRVKAMLTFSEALVLLKAGEDMRHETWPRTHFVRVVFVGGKPELHKFNRLQSSVYTPTQPELLGQDWSKS